MDDVVGVAPPVASLAVPLVRVFQSLHSSWRMLIAIVWIRALLCHLCNMLSTVAKSSI